MTRKRKKPTKEELEKEIDAIKEADAEQLEERQADIQSMAADIFTRKTEELTTSVDDDAVEAIAERSWQWAKIFYSRKDNDV